MALAWTLTAGALVVFPLVALYRAGGAFRYYTRFTAFVLLSAISATAPIPLMLLRPRDYRNALLPAWGARQISRLLGLRWEVRGLENVVNDAGCVVVINHQSALDLLVLAELWPRLPRCTVISKKEIFYLWPFGLAAWLWGTIFIDRLNSKRARTAVDDAAKIVVTRKAKLCMFPEGTRGGGDALLPFKKGAFHVAIGAQVPVQPVVVSPYRWLDARAKRFDSGDNIISILPPIPTKGLTKDDVDLLLETTRAAMMAEHARLAVR